MDFFFFYSVQLCGCFTFWQQTKGEHYQTHHWIFPHKILGHIRSPYRYTSIVLRIMCRQSGQFCWYNGCLKRMFVQPLHRQRCLQGSSTTVLLESWQITHFFLSSCSFSRVSRFSAGAGALLQRPADKRWLSSLTLLDEGTSWWAGSPALPSGGPRLWSPGSPSPCARLSRWCRALRARLSWLLSRLPSRDKRSQSLRSNR